MCLFQCLVIATRLDTSHHCHWLLEVSASCLRALTPWRDPRLLLLGIHMCRRVIMADITLLGLGVLCVGYLDRGIRATAPMLEDQHVLVRSDNRTVVVYINR